MKVTQVRPNSQLEQLIHDDKVIILFPLKGSQKSLPSHQFGGIGGRGGDDEGFDGAEL